MRLVTFRIGRPGTNAALSRRRATLHKLAAPLLLGTMLVHAAPALAVNYTMTEIGIIGGDGDPAPGDITGINAGGQVVGWSQFFSGFGTNGILANSWLWTPSSPNGTAGSAQEIPKPGPFSYCIASGLNDSGHVSCLGDRSRIWLGGTAFTTLPAFSTSFADGSVGEINNVDDVVGRGDGGPAGSNAIVWIHGNPSPTIIDSRESSANGINNAGSYVGRIYDDDGVPYHACAWHNILFGIVPVQLNSQNVYSEAYAINDSRTAVGYVGTAVGAPFVPIPTAWDSNAVQTNLPVLSGGQGIAYDINSGGAIVGYSRRLLPAVVLNEPPTRVPVAVLWQDGSAIDLNSVTTLPAGLRLAFARGINDAGQIAVVAIDDRGAHHAVLLTPRPNDPPVARCKSVTASASGTCQASASIDDGSSDPNGDAISVSQSPAGPYSLGTTSVLLTVTDSGGLTATCTASIVVQDTSTPSAICPAGTTASAGPECTAPVPDVRAGVAATDNCTAPASISLSQAPLPTTPVGLGTTTVVVDAADAAANSTNCSTSFSVVDTTAPSVTCPGTATVSADAQCKALVPDVLGDVVASDNCSSGDGLILSQVPVAGTPIGLGATSIGVDAADAATNSSSCSTAVAVVDTTAPTVSTSLAKPTLWAPSHDLIDVGLTASATDNCSTASVGVAVYSNEPDQAAGDEDAGFSPDAKGIAPGTLHLRSERLGAGNGRVYLIVASAADAAGNVGFRCSTVTVPHDPSQKGLNDVGALAAAALAHCDANGGAPPAGYVPVGGGPVVGPKQ